MKKRAPEEEVPGNSIRAREWTASDWKRDKRTSFVGERARGSERDGQH